MRILINRRSHASGAGFSSKSTVSPSQGTSSVDNLLDVHPGIAWMPAPCTDEPGTPKLRIGSDGASADATVTPTWSRNLTTLLANIQTAIRAVGGDYASVEVTREEDTGKPKFDMNNGAVQLELLHTFDSDTEATGTALGFDVSSDDTGATEYTADYPVRYGWAQAVLDLGAAADVDVIALFGSNLVVGDKLEVYGHTTNLGAGRDTWNATATYSASVSINAGYGYNPLALVMPSSTQTLRYWCVVVASDHPSATSTGTRTADDLRLGCLVLGEWDDYRPSADNPAERPVHARPVQASKRKRGEFGGQVGPVRPSLDLTLDDWTEAQMRTLLRKVLDGTGLDDGEGLRAFPTVWYLGDQSAGSSSLVSPDTFVYGVVDDNLSPTYRQGDVASLALSIDGMSRGF